MNRAAPWGRDSGPMLAATSLLAGALVAITTGSQPVASAEGPRASSYNAQGNQENPPRPTLFIPEIISGADGWTSTVTAFNTSERSTPLFATAYDASGRPSPPGTQIGVLPPFSSQTFQLASDPAAARRSVVLTAEAPIAAVVDHTHPDRNRMSVPAVSAGAEDLDAPLVFKNRNGWNTRLVVMNTGAAPAAASVTYISTQSGGGQWRETLALPGFATVALETARSPALPNDFVGAARVASPARLALVAQNLHRDGSAASYLGQSVGVTHLVAPLLFKNRVSVGTWATGIQLINFAGLPSTLHLTYRGVAPVAGFWEEDLVVGTGEAATLYIPSVAALPDNAVFSTQVTATNGQPVVGLVNHTNYQSDLAMAYSMLAAGGTIVYAPLVYSQAGGWSSGIQIQNLGHTSTDLTVSFHEAPTGRIVSSFTRLLEHQDSATVYLPAEGVPAGFVGAARISTAGAPVAAIVNHVKY